MTYRFNNNDFSIEFNKSPISPTVTDNRGIVTSVAKHGSTVVLCSVCVGDWVGFGNCLPLSVSYSERSYAVNKIPSGFTRREVKNRDNEVLIGRLVDRSLRSTIDESFRYRINVSLTVLSYGAACAVEPVCITAASATLMAAGVPCTSIASVKVSYSQGKWGFGTGEHSVVISGNGYGVSTIEASGAPLSPETLLGCVHFGLPTLIGLTDYTRNVTNKIRKLSHAPVPLESQSSIVDGKALVEAYFRNDLAAINKQSSEFISKWENRDLGKFKWNKLVRSALRSSMLWGNKRIDGRGMDDLRHLSVSNDFIPVYGSFCLARGRTKVLTVPTTSGGNESQTFETIDGNESRKFLLQYNYLLGEDKVSRRDIGHGNLARNALKHFTAQDRFVRVVSEILDSDGSSSMTTVAAACMSLKAVGAINETVAGVSVGLLMEGHATRFMVDITALEDSLSDMDLKIAGAKDGISALQMDLKVPVLPWSTFENSLLYGFDQLTRVLNSLKEQDAHHKHEGHKENRKDDQTQKQEQHHKHPRREDRNHNKDVNTEQVKEKSTDSGDDRGKRHDSQRSESPKGSKDSSKGKNRVTLSFGTDAIARALSLAETVRKEVQVDLYIKENSLTFSGRNLASGLNQFLTLLYDSGKEMFYGTVSDLSELEVEVVLLDGQKCSVKLKEPVDGIQKGLPVCIYKGKFGRWTLRSVLSH